jgi:peroxiredoxin
LTPEQKRGTELIAISVDDREHVQMMLDRVKREHNKAPDFTFLSDPGHRVIDRYGLLNPEGRGWPHPTVYVIDRAGEVRWKFTEINYRIRPTNEMILQALAGLR